MPNYKQRELSLNEKWYHFLVGLMGIPAAVFTAWMFSIVTGQFNVEYPSYVNWIVGYISYEADLVKLAAWRYARENV